MAELNWGLLKQPNFADALATGEHARAVDDELRQKQAARDAYKTYASTGDTKPLLAADPEAYLGVRKDQRAQQAQDFTESQATKVTAAKAKASAARALGSIPEDQRETFLDNVVSHLPDVTPDVIETLRPQIHNTQYLNALAGHFEDEVHVVGRALVTDKGDVRYRDPEPAEKPQYREVGGKLIRLPGQTPEATGQAAGPAGGVGQGGFDAIYHGFTAPHEGGFTAQDGNGKPANFGINQGANPDIDVRSLTPDQAAQIMHDRYWTPSGADKLPPALQAVHFDTAVNMGVGAANNLLQASGGDPQRYLQLREQRFRSIAQNDPSKADKLPGWLSRNQDLGRFATGAAGPAAPSRAGGPEVVFDSGPEWKSDGQGNLINRNGDRKVDPTAQGPEGSSRIPPGVVGPDVLKYLDASTAQQVKALSEGRMSFPSGIALSKPYWQGMLSALSQYDPSFDTGNPGSRAATRKDFTSGKSAQNVTALNTVVGHLDALDKAIDGLGNYDLKINNQLAHGIAEQTGTDARIRQFETSKIAVANELTKVFRGTGGAEADIKAWQGQLDAAASPKALHTVVRQMAELMNSRLEAVGEQYKQGMGTSKDPIELLRPDKQAAFARLMGSQTNALSFKLSPAQEQWRATSRPARDAATQKLVGSANNPVFLNPADPQSSFGNLKPGQWYVGPDGQPRKKPGA